MPKTTKLPKTWTLIKSAIASVWQMRHSLVPIIALIMVPVIILNILTNNDQTLGSYGSFATLIMNVAVIYSVIRLKSGDKKVSVAQAYYRGTARFVAFICVVGLLSLQLIPFLIGGLVYVSGSTGSTLGLGLVEMTLLGVIWLLIASPSLRWITRSIFGLYLVHDSSVGPVAAVKASSSLVRGRSWPVLGRLLAGALLMIVILLVPSLAATALPDNASWVAKIATNGLQLISAFVLVPFASVYGYIILEALGGKPKTS